LPAACHSARFLDPDAFVRSVIVPSVTEPFVTSTCFDAAGGDRSHQRRQKDVTHVRLDLVDLTARSFL
jgi:hypothetical protein